MYQEARPCKLTRHRQNDGASKDTKSGSDDHGLKVRRDDSVNSWHSTPMVAITETLLLPQLVADEAGLKFEESVIKNRCRFLCQGRR
jgi:hypothetical protein